MIWLVGENGMLGRDLRNHLERHKLKYVATDIEVDFTDFEQISAFASGKKIRWIVNCAAYTAVDKAESEEKKAFELNTTGAANLAKIANQKSAKLIQFSTDYVFDGEKTGAYSEQDLVSPTSVYGKTKLTGEVDVQKYHDQYYIIRISWLYGIYGDNFVKTMLRLFNERDELGIIDDQIGAPTYTKQLAKNIVNLIQSNDSKFGIYHYADDGKISWYDFAVEIKKMAQENGVLVKDPKINPITTDMYPLPAKRPANSLFNRAKIVQHLDFEIKDWKENLECYFEELLQQ